MTETVPNLTSIKEDFEELFIEQFPLVYNYIYYYLGNATDAEDLTADIFVRAYEYWGSYSHERGSRGAWLGGIARNMVKTYYQKKSKKSQTTELYEFLCADTNIEGDYIFKEKVQQIFAQIDELPLRQKEIITMKYMLNLTNREIAKILNISESNVGVILHRTIKILQKKGDINNDNQ